MKRTFSAILSELPEMLEFIKGQASLCGIPKEGLQKIELAAEEAIVNVIRHGYPSKGGPIDIECHNSQGDFRVVISDLGIPYDPLSFVKAHGEMRVGGLGLLLMLKMMDKVAYRRHNDANELTLIKYLEKY